MTREETMNVIKLIMSVYPVELTDPMVEAYHLVLEDYIYADIIQGVKLMFKEYVYKTFPVIATIIHYTKKEMFQDELTDTEAYAQLRQTMQNLGSYGRSKAIESLDPLIWQTVSNMGGWDQACMVKTSDVENWVKRFSKTYNKLIERRHNQILMESEKCLRLARNNCVQNLLESMEDKDGK